jgi:hypothetical protein
MILRPNKPLRNYGIYKLLEGTFVLLKRSDDLSFLFESDRWSFRGPVDYRVSHGSIYKRGQRTDFTDDDLFDTGQTAGPPTLFALIDIPKP